MIITKDNIRPTQTNPALFFANDDCYYNYKRAIQAAFDSLVLASRYVEHETALATGLAEARNAVSQLQVDEE